MADLLDLTDPDDPRLGGKASGVARLRRAGLPTPDGRVVPHDHPDPDGAAAQIHRMLDADRYAVRSSAPDEDGSRTSHAGEYPSLLRVEPAELTAAIETVRLAGGQGPIPVLVMPFLEPSAGGVAFSLDPLTGERSVVMSVVSGHHGGVTDGTADPVEVRVADGGGVDLINGGPLGAGVAADVAELVVRAAEAIGAPADVEFVVISGAATLLQARPITGFPVWEAPPGTWTLELDHADGPVSPLWADMAHETQTTAFSAAFAECGALLETIQYRTIGDHAYTRAVPLGGPGGPPPPAPVLGLLARAVPALRDRCATAHRFLRDGGPERVQDETEQIDWEGAAAACVEAIPDADAPVAEVQSAIRLITSTWAELFTSHFRWAICAYGLVLGAWGLAMEAEGRSAAEAVAPLGGGGATRDWLTRLPAAREAVAGDPRTRTALSEAVDGGDDEAIAVALAAAAAAHPSVRASVKEADVVNIGYDPRLGNLGDQPRVVARLLLAPATPPVTPGADVPPRLHPHLRLTRQVYQQRDRNGSALIRVLGAARRVAQRTGDVLVAEGALGDPDHVWAVPWATLTAWANGQPLPRDLAGAAAERWAAFQRHAALTPPPVIGPPPEDQPDFRFLPRAARSVARRLAWLTGHSFGTSEGAREAKSDGTTFVGRPSAPGVHEGRARVIRRVDQTAAVEPGEVLVAPFTTPAWAPLLERCGAVVTTHGGPLSHAAIVSRELGLPAVCGVADALNIPDGAMVEVDGTAGKVVLR